MSATNAIETKILTYFDEAPFENASLMLRLCTGRVKERETGVAARRAAPAGRKRGRPSRAKGVTPYDAERQMPLLPDDSFVNGAEPLPATLVESFLPE
jgi:hypothetical protein